MIPNYLKEKPLETALLSITFPGTAKCLWRLNLKATSRHIDLTPPLFHLDGKRCRAEVETLSLVTPVRTLANGVEEHIYQGQVKGWQGLHLEVLFRITTTSPVVRFAYRMVSEMPRKLTKPEGREVLEYFTVSIGRDQAKEQRFSEFDEAIHSFRPTERVISASEFENAFSFMGPMLVMAGAKTSWLVAYEHGSQAPNAFVEFRLTPGRKASLTAKKGNYLHGQEIKEGVTFETIWFQVAAVVGDEEELAKQYRAFALHSWSENAASRKPYLFYNTWGFQERNKWWNKKTYLDSMNQERILAEIEVAHQMGLEVFVLDTGWYSKTGDWQVNLKFFPDNLKAIREKLAKYGMKLGLWFSPTQAAVTSRVVKEMPDCRMSWEGKLNGPNEVWETEASYNMCLVSPYWKSFADELIRLSRELGVTYFKWDAVGQYGCNDPGHWHGGLEHSPQERADRYAFEMGRYMIKVVDRLCHECPEAIVDFDITEGGRFVGLGYLAAGKYFLINNGPYFPNFDQPYDWATATVWSNVFVYPGPARSRVCRGPLDFDKWLPSVLFLTHYLPDDPEESQIINIASLILGQNGIWGDLLKISPEGVARFGHWHSLYKQVRDSITAANPVRQGILGGSPEMYEKIEESTGRGAVAIFAEAWGTYRLVTKHSVAREFVATADTQVSFDAEGRAILEVSFEKPGARLVFFGVSQAGQTSK